MEKLINDFLDWASFFKSDLNCFFSDFMKHSAVGDRGMRL